jgi:orotate phosphoribosyltransferase
VPAGVLIALDRQERGRGEQSAVQEVEAALGAPVVSIIGLAELIDHLAGAGGDGQVLASIREYRARFGVRDTGGS